MYGAMHRKFIFAFWLRVQERPECPFRLSFDGAGLAQGGPILGQQSFHNALIDTGKLWNVINQHMLVSLMD